ncbi:MAG: phosphatidylglycerophosphatase A [Candidatus Omnitrophica bacterium]|nr:phosphatidylglycerophosphatase A [Candidatus Omnitrophota bacterium]
MQDKQIRLFSTFFYIGFFPYGPGTMASLAGAILALLLVKLPLLYIILTLVITRLGFVVSGEMEKIMDQKDPGCVVIDEVAGILVAFFLLPMTPAVFFTAFFLFRAFDMFKIYPENVLEDKGGSTGIMMDDIMAGVYTNITMQVAIRLAHIV